MRTHRFSMVLILAATLAGAQQASESKGPLPTFGELLRQHNVQLTEPALVDALKNADPEVRDLAAQKLAEDKAYNAIPAIHAALASENMPWTRMNIAFALAQLGEASGFDALERNCKDRQAPTGIRTRSAEYLLRFDRASAACFDALLGILETGTNGYKAEVASLLPKFGQLPAEETEKGFAGLVQALHAPSASVRMAAGQALAQLGDRRAIAELRDAAASEREPAVRSRIEGDLKMLEERQSQ